MPPQPFSRHFFTSGIKDSTERLYLTDRDPFRFVEINDNRFHTVRAGDTLWTLADRFFDGVTDNAAQLWWVIADFQPEPIIDPTLALTPGRIVVVPSQRTLTEQIFSESRRS